MQWWVNLVSVGSCKPCAFIAMFRLKQSWCASCNAHHVKICGFWQHSSPSSFWLASRLHHTPVPPFRLSLLHRPLSASVTTSAAGSEAEQQWPPHSASVPFIQNCKAEWRHNILALQNTVKKPQWVIGVIETLPCALLHYIRCSSNSWEESQTFLSLGEVLGYGSTTEAQSRSHFLAELCLLPVTLRTPAVFILCPWNVN